METKNIAVAGAVTLGVAALGYLGYKHYRNKKADKPVEQVVKAEVKAEVKTPAAAKKVESAPAKAPERPTLSVVKREKLVENGKILKPEDPRVIKLMQVNASFGGQGLELDLTAGRDRVETVTIGDEQVVSVARARVPENEPQSDAPTFWTHFYNNIRRPEVVELKPEDFCAGNRPALSKGYHKAMIEGFDGPAVVHVTKGHVSAVVHVGGTVFMGFSTSGSRFPKAVSSEADIAGTFHLDARAAKDFLNGR